ncbi:hypothetical protein G5V59_13830 [Nocardioides sp. W3-2-3]|uniref:hypothetical protein n=1 Tax=Nocardioides convexus TaxID=2712224 RepID=UPI0024187FE5|nr:hypothetical protein [Nocardioides convexus]NHA00725.1 hypothetical protein [Nocardioides convexus]
MTVTGTIERALRGSAASALEGRLGESHPLRPLRRRGRGRLPRHRLAGPDRDP